jgi:hypothetical protein
MKIEADRIRQRAYDIWMAAGCPAGMDTAHWNQAERELLAEEGIASAPTDGATNGHDAAPTSDGSSSSATAAPEEDPARRRLRLNWGRKSNAEKPVNP